jgi:hypothetical protein
MCVKSTSLAGIDDEEALANFGAQPEDPTPIQPMDPTYAFLKQVRGPVGGVAAPALLQIQGP